jgi:hypothetical protein
VQESAPPKANATPTTKVGFPRLRWVVLVFMAVWVPSYWVVWGWRNFLQLCDVTMVLTAIAVWRGSAWLLSSQAVGSLIINGLWGLDVAARLLLGRHVIGGTEYMWNPAFPAWIRALSLFHLALPVLHVWCLRRTGYDQRAWRFEVLVVAVVFVASRLLAAPSTNPNFVFAAPLLRRPIGAPPVHLLLVWVTQLVVLMLPVHLVLRRWLPRPATDDAAKAARPSTD